MSQHNEIIERARDRVVSEVFHRLSNNCTRDGVLPERIICLIYEEVLNAFKAGVNAKADAMMAAQAEGGAE